MKYVFGAVPEVEVERIITGLWKDDRFEVGIAVSSLIVITHRDWRIYEDNLSRSNIEHVEMIDRLAWPHAIRINCWQIDLLIDRQWPCLKTEKRP